MDIHAACVLVIGSLFVNLVFSLEPAVRIDQRKTIVIQSQSATEENYIEDEDFRGDTKYSNPDEDYDDGRYLDTIPGKVGVDFPSYSTIPKTSFSCRGKTIAGYYADVETDCQIFHVCLANNHKISFICPRGSVFNQRVLVCDWWYEVDCQYSNAIAELSNDFLKRTEAAQNEPLQYDQDEFDLSLASSGEGKQNEKKKN